MDSDQDNSKPVEPKTTLQRFPGRFTKLSFLFLAGTVVALAARYLLPNSYVVSVLLWAWLGLSFFMLLLLFLNWYLEPSRDTTPRKDVIDIFIKIASSALFILSLVVAWLSFENTRRETSRNLQLAQITLENNRAEQRSRRFTDALERLGGDTPSKRLAGVYAFTQLDSDFKSKYEFEKDDLAITPDGERQKLLKQREKEEAEHWAIIQILTSHIQEYSAVPKDSLTKPRAWEDEPAKDINGILQYLGTRKLTYEAGEPDTLDFKGADLTGYFKRDRKCDVTKCNLDCNTPNFDGADFTGAHLIRADFQGVKLRKANFNDADLTKANFDCADLTDAQFRNADISGADLSRATLSRDDQLRAAFGNPETKCPTNFTFDTTAGTCVK